ncbi:hypothetical protein KIPB_002521, partial [Kipferlia bialata]
LYAFLINWIIGDLTNLLGAVIIGALPTQIFSALYYCLADVLLFVQFRLYSPKDKQGTVLEGTNLLADTTQDTSLAIHPLAMLLTLALALGTRASSVPSVTLSDDETPLTWQFWVGWMLGWVSGVNYVASRINQILKNVREKSPETLSISMFIIAICGNTTYALSIALTATTWDLIWPQIPWIVGSAGVLGLDVAIGYQYFHYSKINRELKAELRE